MIRSVVLALIFGVVSAAGADAQVTTSTNPTPPVGSTTQAPTKPANAETPPPPPTPAAIPVRPADNRQVAAAAAKKPKVQPVAAVNQRDPLTARGRFANPGRVGKYSEYYTPNTPMYGYPGLVNRHASFGNGGALTRAEQIQTFQAGQYRTQNIQNNINTYGRPVGFGFGFGLGYGRGLGGFPR